MTLGWFLVIFVTTPILAGLFFVFVLTKVTVRWHHSRLLSYIRLADAVGERMGDLARREWSEGRDRQIVGALREMESLTRKSQHHMEEWERWKRIRSRLLK